MLLSSVIMKICDDKSAQTIAQYIENNYSKVEWDYQFDDYYANRGLLNQHIMSVKKVEGSKSDSTENSDDSYTDLGPIECYISNIGDEHIANEIKDIHLYAKSYEGKSLYFIKSKYLSNYYPLTKGSWTRSNTRFNARCSLGGNVFYYVNVSLWDSSGSSSNGGSSGNVSTDRGLQPVQEWVPCPVCGNSLKVGLCQHCNGTGQDLYYTRSYRDCPNCGGMKKCPACGGNGGHYETRYR